MALPLLAVSVVLTGYSAVKQNQAARNAAAVDTATADYNAKVDQAQAAQIDLDTRHNIALARAEEAQVLSRQEAAYSAAGVLANSGSPLHAMITNAGRMEQQIQQQYVDSQQKQQQLYSAARVGRLVGEAQASADRARGTLALVDGGARIAGLAYQGYQSGAFKSLGFAPSTGPKLASTKG